MKIFFSLNMSLSLACLINFCCCFVSANDLCLTGVNKNGFKSLETALIFKLIENSFKLISITVKQVFVFLLESLLQIKSADYLIYFCIYV